MTRPTNPAYDDQTFMVEFEVPGALDGATLSPEIRAPSPNQDPQSIYRPDVLGNLGLINPDYVVENGPDQLGTRGNRLIGIVWIDASVAGDVDAVIEVVDVVDGTLLVQEQIAPLAGLTTYYNKEGFVVPQGSLIRISGFAAGLEPHRVRLFISYMTEKEVVEFQKSQGSGSAVDVFDDGALVVADADGLNFTGSGVAVSAGGPGQADIDIPGSAAGPNFVYQPGGVSANNIYADWNDLVVALQALAGPKIVEVDDSFVAIPLVPAGTYDVNGAVFQGRYGSQQTTLRGSVGSRLENLFEIRQNLQLQNADPALALIELNALEFFDVRDGASLASIVDYPVVEFSGPGAAVLRLEEARIQNLALGDTVVAAKGGAGTSLVIESYDGSVVDDNTLEIDAGSTIVVRMRDFGSDFSRVHSAATGALTIGNITASSSGIPKYDNLFDSGLPTLRWRSTVSRISLAVALLGAGTPTATFGANSVGAIDGASYAVVGATAQREIANPASPQLSAVGVHANAYAGVAGSLAQAYASGPGSSVHGLAQTFSADNARLQSTGKGALASGYVGALGYDSTMLASGVGSHAFGYSKSYGGAGYGATTIQATNKGSTAFGAASYFGEISATGWGALARGAAVGGAFAQSSPGRIQATGLGAMASGTAAGGDLIAAGPGSHVLGYARYNVAVGAPPHITADGRGSFAGGLAQQGFIEAGTVPGSSDAAFAFGLAKDPIGGGASYSTIRAAQYGSVAMGQARGPNALIEAYNVASIAFGLALTTAVTATAEVRTSADQAGCMAAGLAAATGTNTARVSAEDNGAFVWGYASATNGNSYVRATGEGAIALGRSENGTVHASGEGSLARAFAQMSYVGGGGTATALASGPGSTVIGQVMADSANVGLLQATSNGAFAGGYVRTRGQAATISAAGQGSFAFGRAAGYAGVAYGPVNIVATNGGDQAGGVAQFFADIIASGYGSTANGYASGGYPYTPKGQILASSYGAHASGTVVGGIIRAAGSGAFAHGLARGFGALLGAELAASVVFGLSHNYAPASGAAEVVSTQSGTFAGGTALASNGYTSRISADENGGIVAGKSVAQTANAYIQATAEGCIAHGSALNGTILASGEGAMARGYAEGGSIIAAGEGSFVSGKSGGGTISSTVYGVGALANGEVAAGRTITATTRGATALGAALSAVGGADITASGYGAMAQGNADTGPITASASNAVQFGPGVNSVADSLRIGSGGLHFKGTGGAFGAYADGQFWVANGNVYCYSGGSVQNLTNIP